jgi:putative ABC transport system permease protein
MNNPMVKEAIPLAYGDSYLGYRILGTTDTYLKKYNAEFAQGRAFSTAMEVTIGADIAAKTKLKVGGSFLGSHGEVKEGHVHEEHPYTVVGILKKSNTVLDRLVLTDIESVWQVHSETHEGEHGEQHEANDHHEEKHDHHEEHHEEKDEHKNELTQSHQPLKSERNNAEDEKEITAVLLKYKSKRAVFNMPRIINKQTNMQAVLPGMEINRLFYMLGIGVTTLKLIAGGIMLMAGFSVFFVLYNRQQERKFELALMRSVGFRPQQLFVLLLLEGVLLAIIGYALGWLISRVGIYFINQQAIQDFNLSFEFGWVPGEEWLLLLTFLIGVISALLPAWQAMRLDVSAVLTKN